MFSGQASVAEAIAVAASVLASGAAAETFYVDSRNGAPTASSGVLASGAPYTVGVHGTFSRYSPAWTQGGTCGAPEIAPIYPSPGVANGPVGFDSDRAFAEPQSCSGTYPKHASTIEFSLDGGSSWSHVEPVAAGDEAHEWIYSLTGQGSALRIRMTDCIVCFDDNYGMFRVEAAPGAPTAVVAVRVGAQRTSQGVRLRWRTASTAGVLGFHVYRSRGAGRVRASSSLVPAAFLGGGTTFSFVDRRAPAGALVYWIQAVRTSGATTWLPPAHVGR
ncbi:MAG: hypothetical protein ABR521_02915 [Gaiellaceae bacterium]